MAVRVRLTRVGSKKNPIWRVVVADRRSPRDGRFIEMIGHYNPQTQPSRIVIDEERLRHWLDRGAEPSNTVKKLMRAQASGIAGPAEPAALDGDEPGTEGEAATAPEAGTEPAGAPEAGTEPATAAAGADESVEPAAAGEPAADGDTESG